MANSILRAGAQGATFHAPSVEITEGNALSILTIEDWALLPSGRLKDVLTRKYVLEGSSTADLYAFADAWATEGGIVNCTEIYSQIEATYLRSEYTYYVKLGVDQDGYPVISTRSNDAGVDRYFRISVAYSASA